MKTKILLLLLWCVSFCYAQDIEYDFKAGAYTRGLESDKSVIPVGNNTMITFKITNINTFKYTVTITGKNVNYVTESSEEMRTIFRLPTPKATVAPQLEPIAEATNLMKAEKDNASGTFQTTMKELVKACEKYVAAVKELEKLELHRIELTELAKRSSFKPSFNAIDETVLRQRYYDFIDTYAEAEAKYEKAKKEAKDSIVATTLMKPDIVEEANDKLEEAHEAINKTDIIKLINDIIILQKGLSANENFNVVSAPIQTDGADVLAFEVIITPNTSGEFMPLEAGKTLLVEIPVKGGLKIDFSVGPVFSFGSNASDHLFYLKEESDGVSSLQTRENRNDVLPGLAAMIHATWRTGKFVSPGVMFGVGAGFQGMDDTNLSFYTGGTAVIGKHERVMLSAGISLLGVERLKKGEYNVGQTYATDEIDINDVTEKVIKSSFFVSFTYNLTTRTVR